MLRYFVKSTKTIFGKNGLIYIILLFIIFNAGVSTYTSSLWYREGMESQETIPNDTIEPGTGLPIGNLYNPVSGISRSQIPDGDEDLYILKTQIVPPVCPKCPDVINNGDNTSKKCTACPPCARCPEPSFECKKVPNYNSTNQSVFPMPLLNDFSQF